MYIHKHEHSVGFGDILPETQEARLFTIFFALIGISIVALAGAYTLVLCLRFGVSCICMHIYVHIHVQVRCLDRPPLLTTTNTNL